MKKLLSLAAAVVVLLSAVYVPAAPKKVRLGYLRNDLHHLAAWVAIEKGFFRDEGISVEVAGIFNAGPEEMSAFASRSIDAGYLGVAPSTTGVANKSASVKAVSLANSEGSAIVVRKDSSLREVKDLAGKTVAIPGYATVQDFLLRKALEGAGIDTKKVNIIVIKPPEMITALGARQIDAFIAWEPHPSKAVTGGIGKVLITSSKIWKDHPCCIVAVESSFYRENPAAVRALLKAHVRATEFIGKNPDEAVRIGQKYTGMDEATIREAMRNIRYHHDINEKDVREYLQYLLRFGYIKVVDVDALSREYLAPEGRKGSGK
ncbi:MAG: aliphatic sulfonate ABC transporter substrate-binding protein [Alphaproteobacteria bacterium]|uniref:Aliphatic sulfonate ABC transporter substrate-binding protein n=1 Tax=Candidatus Nitrobium versatile TaxID=2884831 RepID=A0A953JCD8_9BACT|nr:aliphatic sulfonate ABC transporter substrate-binding protein [Candidatus Nitrobium versatile]